MWIKICGTTSLEDAEIAVEAGADALGFVFARSPRRVTAQQVAVITKALSRKERGLAVEKIGVFVDASTDFIADTVLEAGLTGVQLHGKAEELPEQGIELRHRLAGYRAIRTLPVLHFHDEAIFAEDLATLAQSGLFEAVLVDAYSRNARGGTGSSFDWAMARRLFRHWNNQMHLIVAGGLRHDNVREAVLALAPWGVDVVSGVEAEPARKDPAKVKKFVQEAQAASQKPK